MPLSKARMRERKKLDRVKPKSNLNTLSDVKPKLEQAGILVSGNRISLGMKPRLVNPPPCRADYPELDADGQVIPEY